MIAAILFDFGQTLVDSSRGFRSAERLVQDRLFAELRSIDRARFLDCYRTVRTRWHEQSRFSRVGIWQSVLDELGACIDADTLERWEGDYWALVDRETVPFPETASVVETLSLRFRLALITNTQGQKLAGVHRLAAFPDLRRHFDTVIVAGEGGIPPKPDPQPFRLGLERLGVEADRALYVGDDHRIDVLGAGAVGMQPVWLQHHLVERRWPRVSTTVPIISTLTGLLDPEQLVRRPCSSS